MNKTKSSPQARQQPLAAGQLWQMAEADLQVKSVGKLLVYYKLGKHDAVRLRISCELIDTVEKFLRSNGATLL